MARHSQREEGSKIRVMITIYVVFLYSVAGATPAMAQSGNPCAAITDNKSRLQCYDAAARASVPSHAVHTVSPAALEEPIIVEAKAAVKEQLRDPDSAKFDEVEAKTVAGKRVVCGAINSKNARGGMTGPIPFAFDGNRVAIMAWEGGPANGTSSDAEKLAATLRDRLDEYNAYCKRFAQ
jgi:hypothetical protein